MHSEGERLNYRDVFEQQDAVDDYLRIYDHDSMTGDKLVWDRQRAHLSTVLTELVDRHGVRSALDYACGGGRILAEYPASLPDPHGWDSSPIMLQRCALAVPRARLSRIDLTETSPLDVDARFDVITVFRLFLNLEPDRREIVARRLGELLRPGGFLIFDNHGNRRSLRHLSVAVGGFRHRFANEWSDSEIRVLAEQAGLEIVQHWGFGWLPDAVHRSRWTATIARRVETWLLSRTLSPLLAIRVVYLARKSDGEQGKSSWS